MTAAARGEVTAAQIAAKFGPHWLMERAQPGEGGCIEWLGAVPAGGPQCHFAGRTWYVRRLLWAATRGRLPARASYVVAVCDNPACVAPAHLHQQTRSSAMRGNKPTADTRRRVAQARRKHSRLTPEDVAAIRASAEPGCVLDARYGLSSGHASQIRRGKIWADFGNPLSGLGSLTRQGREDDAGDLSPRALALARGEPRYRPLRPCPQGHQSARYASSGDCVECMRQQPAGVGGARWLFDWEGRA